MRTALALLLSFAALGLAQEEAIKAKRVASVTWDLQSHKLVWVVQEGVAQNGEFVPSSEQRYEISPEDQAMAVQGEQREVAGQEAAWLQHLLNVLTVYCAQSVIWWDSGPELPLDEDQPTAAPPVHNPGAKPATDVDNKTIKIKAAPPRKTPSAKRLVASNAGR